MIFLVLGMPKNGKEDFIADLNLCTQENVFAFSNSIRHHWGIKTTLVDRFMVID